MTSLSLLTQALASSTGKGNHLFMESMMRVRTVRLIQTEPLFLRVIFYAGWVKNQFSYTMVQSEKYHVLSAILFLTTSITCIAKPLVRAITQNSMKFGSSFHRAKTKRLINTSYGNTTTIHLQWVH